MGSVDHGFDRKSGFANDYTIGIYYFPVTTAALGNLHL